MELSGANLREFFFGCRVPKAGARFGGFRGLGFRV